MKYAPYSKEYKNRMIRFREERIRHCEHNIKVFSMMLESALYYREQKNHFLITINKERNLLKYLRAID